MSRLIEWTKEKMREHDLLPYDYALRYTDIFGTVSYLQTNNIICMFSEEDADTIMNILNGQVEAATKKAVEAINNG